MLEKERHDIILRFLRQHAIASVHDIVELTQQSEATIRRDFAKLDDEGALRRIRGGVELIPKDAEQPGSATHSETGLEFRKHIQQEKKRLIAKKAASLCIPGETIVIDGGSTTYFMAEYLSEAGLKILTNSFAIAEYLINHTRNTVILTGGTVYPDSGMILNPFPDSLLEHYYAAKVFMGVEGLDAHGATNTEAALIQMEQRMIECADEVIIVADSSKFETRGHLRLCGYDRISRIITDAGIPNAQRALLDGQGVGLIII